MKNKELGREFLEVLKEHIADVSKKQKQARMEVPKPSYQSNTQQMSPWYTIEQKAQMARIYRHAPKQPKCGCYKLGERCRLHGVNAQVVEYDQTNVAFMHGKK